MMEGIEKEWNYVGNRLFATYTKLLPNEYVFKVKGSNNDGLWNKEGISLSITITPPFWQKLWFRITCVLFIISLLFTSYQIRTARIRGRNRELEQHVLERTAQLEATNLELESFTYSVSHDLRAPLRGMDGFSQILLEDYSNKIDKKGKEYLKRIHKASHTMSQLIDDLLQLLRFSRSEMNFEEINLSKLVTSIIADYRQMNTERQVKFKITKNVIIKGDTPSIKILFKKLFDNAWKFTRDQKETKIEFGVMDKNGKPVYFIRDNGIGFDMSYAEKLFETFQRQHTGFEGTGAGLATAKSIVLRHGGQIWAKGKNNEGATFFITFK